MTTRSRSLSVILMICGLGMIITSIIGLSSYYRTPMFPIIEIATGLLAVCLGGYRYLFPNKTNSSTSALLGAIGGFIVVLVLVFPRVAQRGHSS
jgi:predicted MFS family arabinose efflux permease